MLFWHDQSKVIWFLHNLFFLKFSFENENVKIILKIVNLKKKKKKNETPLQL